MAGCRAVVVLGLVSAYRWAELGPGVSSCRTWGPKAGAHWLVGRAVAQGVLGLLLAHWWLRLGPGVSASSLVFVTVSRVDSRVPEEKCGSSPSLYLHGLPSAYGQSPNPLAEHARLLCASFCL